MNLPENEFERAFQDIGLEFDSNFEIASNIPPPISKGQEDELFHFINIKATVSTSSIPGTPYRPLIDPNEIRVLQILPGSFNDEIQCSLIHAVLDFEYKTGSASDNIWYTDVAISLNDRKPIWYTALSYVWGPPNFSSIIKCDGHELRTTPNLESVIRHLRHQDHEIRLWIDQICINQKDLNEKSKQVQIMALIYNRSFNTVIWLGGGSFDDAIEILRQVHASWQFTTGELSDEQFNSLPLRCSRLDAWSHLNTLFRSPWFSRVWVIQEVVQSIRPRIMTGSGTVQWEEFSGCCITLLESGFISWIEQQSGGLIANGDSTMNTTCKIIQDLHSLCVEFKVLRKNNMLLTLGNTRYAAATDPRDKVYAILGLCDSVIYPDYNKSYQDVFQEVTVAWIQKGIAFYNTCKAAGNVQDSTLHTIFSLLSCVDHPPDGNIPSWVPDWRLPRQAVPLAFSTSALGVYRAGNFQKETKIVLLPGDRSIKLQGVFVDSVDRILSGMVTPELANYKSNLFSKNLAELAAFVSACHRYPSSDQLFTAFWKTLVAGRDGSGRLKCPPEYEEIFSLLLDEATGNTPSLPGQIYSVRRQKGYLTLDSLKRRKPGETFRDFRMAYSRAVQSRKLCVTKEKYIGLLPRYAETGDSVWVLMGCCVPLLLRQLPNKRFQLLGECYVHGIMDGEVENFDRSVEEVQIV